MIKKIYILFGSFFIFLFPSSSAWSQANIMEVSGVYVVKIVFGSVNNPDNKITSVAIGRPDLVDVSFKENQVFLQALVDNFQPTNLLVDISCGLSEGYKLIYKDEPKKYIVKETGCNTEPKPKVSSIPPLPVNNIKPPPTSSVHKISSLPSIKSDKEIIGVVKEKRNYISSVGIVDRKYEMNVLLNGIWEYNEFFYIKTTFVNKSTLNYVIDGVQFSLTNRKKSKKTSRVNRPLKQYIVYNSGDLTVDPKNSLVAIFKIEKIAITADKKLVLDIWEHPPGERKFSLHVSSKTLLRVESL